jgi:hypothetical protein
LEQVNYSLFLMVSALGPHNGVTSILPYWFGAATLTIDPAMPVSQNSASHGVPKTEHMAERAVLFILHFLMIWFFGVLIFDHERAAKQDHDMQHLLIHILVVAITVL